MKKNTEVLGLGEHPDLLDFEEKLLGSLHKKLLALAAKTERTEKDIKRYRQLEAEFTTKAQQLYKHLDNWQRTQVARHPKRPYALDYIAGIFTTFDELAGDRFYGDDSAIVGGVAELDGQGIVVVAHQKGRSTDENIKRNFGMPNPEGYRKALRLFRLANKFNLPIITFIDTPGAYPGIGAEERGQAEAIAKNLQFAFTLRVPVIAMVIGEGGSGGALALSVADHLMMLENSIYSVISPESCAAILWKSGDYKVDAANALKNDAFTAKQLKVVDEIIKEAPGGAHRGLTVTSKHIHNALSKQLKKLTAIKPDTRIAQRIKKFAGMGIFTRQTKT